MFHSAKQRAHIYGGPSSKRGPRDNVCFAVSFKGRIYENIQNRRIWESLRCHTAESPKVRLICRTTPPELEILRCHLFRQFSGLHTERERERERERGKTHKDMEYTRRPSRSGVPIHQRASRSYSNGTPEDPPAGVPIHQRASRSYSKDVSSAASTRLETKDCRHASHRHAAADKRARIPILCFSREEWGR